MASAMVYLAALLATLLPVDAALVQPRCVGQRPPPRIRFVPARAALVEAPEANAEGSADTIDEPASTEEPSSVFTMEQRDDGWNDVRSAIEKAKKERAPALEQLKSSYIAPLAPAARWTKVIAGELVDIVKPSVTDAEQKAALPTVQLPKVELVKLPKVEMPTREYDTERQRQVAEAMFTLAALIPQPKPSAAAKEATRPAPKPVVKETAGVTSVAAYATLGAYIAVPLALALFVLDIDVSSLLG